MCVCVSTPVLVVQIINSNVNISQHHHCTLSVIIKAILFYQCHSPSPLKWGNLEESGRAQVTVSLVLSMVASSVSDRISPPTVYTHEYDIPPGTFDTFNDKIGGVCSELDAINFTSKQ